MNELSPQAPHRDDQLVAGPRTPSPPPALTAEQRAALGKASRDASIIQSLAFPAAMAGAVPIGKEVGPSGFKLYLDRVVRDAGSPTDPIERMIVEQLALAHQRVAQLHTQAAQAKQAEAAKVYLTAAIRLTGELRRLALALRQYREPMPKKSFTVIKQQNLAAGRQQVAYIAQGEAPGQIPFSADSELASTPRLSHAPATPLPTESTASCGRPAEPVETRTDYSSGSRAFAAGGDEEQAVDSLDGATDARGQGPLGSQRPAEAEGGEVGPATPG